MTIAQRLKEGDAVDKNAVEASLATSDKVSALRSALRSAPPKKGARSRSPLKAAVAQLLPDLLAFRAKGYTSAELAEIMRSNGFVIAARTLNKYINEARARPANRRKKKIAPVAPPNQKRRQLNLAQGQPMRRERWRRLLRYWRRSLRRKLEKLRRTFLGIASMTMCNEQDSVSRQIATLNPDSKGHSDMATATAAAVKPRPRAAALPAAVKRVALVANEKGGVGKSVFTRTLVDHLRTSGKRVAAYDADGSVGATARVLGSRDASGVGRTRAKSGRRRRLLQWSGR